MSCVWASVSHSFSDQSVCFGRQMGPVMVPPEGWFATPMPSLGEQAHTPTHTMVARNFTSFLASMSIVLTDWEQTGRLAISSDTWEHPEDPGSHWQAEETAGYTAKTALLKDQLKSHYKRMTKTYLLGLNHKFHITDGCSHQHAHWIYQPAALGVLRFLETKLFVI